MTVRPLSVAMHVSKFLRAPVDPVSSRIDFQRTRTAARKCLKYAFTSKMNALPVPENSVRARCRNAGRVGGIVAQIQDGETGWLVDSSSECAEACIEILRDPTEARQRALRGKEYVRRHFLTPRLLRDWLVLFNQLLGNDTSGAEVSVVSATA